MLKDKTKEKNSVKNKRKLTRSEKKQIAELIRKAKPGSKASSAQESIPFLSMHPDGICRVDKNRYSKCIYFSDINYQLAGADEKTAIFENWCDFLNYFDSSVDVQLSFINQGSHGEAKNAIEIPAKEDAFDAIRSEYQTMLSDQLSKGNNGLVKLKFVTFSVEAENMSAAKARLNRIETDMLNNFKVLGVSAHSMNGYERLKTMHGIFHPEGEPFFFYWDYIVPSGLSTKDFIAPSSFYFGEGRTFRMGSKLGAVSFLEILAPELNDRILSDLATYGGEAKNLLQDLQSRNERMFLVTFLVVNMANSKRKLDNDVFAAAGIAQKYNCALTRLDFQQEEGLMSSIPLGRNEIEIQRGLTTSSTAVFIPFITQELFQGGEALYYGLNALSSNMILCDRKQLKNPNGLILGTPGSGKSFAAKREITNAFLITDDDIYISDPEAEYAPLVNSLLGQVIRISPTSKEYINPMDINLNYSKDSL